MTLATKPTVYLETSIPSYLTSRTSHDVTILARQIATREWWDSHRQAYELYISQFVIDEASQGNVDAAKKRIKVPEGVSELAISNKVDELANHLIVENALPAKARYDAFHIACATVSRIDFMLSWNFKHIANAVMYPKIAKCCHDFYLEMPIICTPLQLMELPDVS